MSVAAYAVVRVIQAFAFGDGIRAFTVRIVDGCIWLRGAFCGKAWMQPTHRDSFDRCCGRCGLAESPFFSLTRREYCKAKCRGNEESSLHRKATPRNSVAEVDVFC